MARHGMYGTRTHNSWRSMKDRCKYETHPHYKHYGGRGITYDPRWKYFENFYEDMGERPEGMSLDRKDSNLGYYKENCRWSDESLQHHNIRDTARNISGYRGVSFRVKEQNWAAWIMKDGKAYAKYGFKTAQESAKWYDDMAIKLHGEHAVTNKKLGNFEKSIEGEI